MYPFRNPSFANASYQSQSKAHRTFNVVGAKQAPLPCKENANGLALYFEPGPAMQYTWNHSHVVSHGVVSSYTSHLCVSSKVQWPCNQLPAISSKHKYSEFQRAHKIFIQELPKGLSYIKGPLWGGLQRDLHKVFAQGSVPDLVRTPQRFHQPLQVLRARTCTRSWKSRWRHVRRISTRAARKDL